MEGREEPPKQNDITKLTGGAKLGRFWDNCKSCKRCSKPPYNQLLTNPVLRTNYRATRRHECGSFTIKATENVDHLRAQPPTLRLMSGRTQPPIVRDPTMLDADDGGTRLGRFWES